MLEKYTLTKENTHSELTIYANYKYINSLSEAKMNIYMKRFKITVV